jgi:DNA-binding NtrC family response regulator
MKNEEKHSIENSYNLVAEVLKKHSAPYNKNKIILEIQRVLKGEHLEEYYLSVIVDYIYEAIRHRDENVKDIFIHIFYEDIEQNYKAFYYTSQIAMKMEGIHDLLMIEYQKMNGANDLPPAKIARLVYYHATLDKDLIIRGETGTGKELMARAVHTISARRKNPFREINCAAIPDNLLESELFGYEKGAHSMANKMKQGILELANGGTVFLDEIGKMPPQLQAKILKVVNEKNFNRLGGEEKEPIRINVRFIAATQPIDQPNIIPDLLYRLGYPAVIEMTTLNERLKELGRSLINMCLQNVLHRINMSDEKIEITADGYEFLENYTYKGNYRELENMLLGALIDARASLPIIQEGGTFIYKKGSKIKKITTHNFSFDVKEDSIMQTKISDEEIRKDLFDIPLKDIVDHAENIMKSIIEEKMSDVITKGGDIRKTLISEGLSADQYQNFLKKIKTHTNKGVRDFK